MSVEAYTDQDKFPGAQSVITDPPSLALTAGSTTSPGYYVDWTIDEQVPDLTAEPWATDLPGSTLTITENTNGNTGDFEVATVEAPGEITTVEDTGSGNPTAGYCTPDGHSGLDDLALRLQNGYTDWDSTPHAAVPSTIINGKLYTEAAPSNPAIAAY